MSGIIPAIIVILSMLIFVFLQITPATFSIFYHYALGKFSKKKADDLSLSFILGSEIFTTLIWLLSYIIIFALLKDVQNHTLAILDFTFAGIMFALAFIVLIFYFNRGKNTTTFLPRNLTRGIYNRTQSIKNRTDACFLGFFVGIFELIFTLPVFVATVLVLESTAAAPRALAIIFNVLAAALPLFVIRYFYHSDRNLADITRARVKLKPHFRFILTLTYLAISIALINLGIIING